MKTLIERIPLFVQYFLYKTDGHSLQAPFAFDFYKNVILASKADPSDPEIEQKRVLFQNSKKDIEYHSFGQTSRLNDKKRKKISEIARMGISSLKKSKLFSRIIQEFKCENIVELGTSIGVNTAYLAKANPEASVITVEGHPELSDLAKNLFRELNLKNINALQGNIDQIVHSVAERLEKIDFLFMDANHSSKAVINYYQSFSSKFTKDTIVVIDDIRWSKDMYIGWKKLINKEAVSHSFDLGELGVLIHKGTEIKQHYILDF